MAWRIDESVVRGEIDNGTRGRLIGRIWLSGRSDPLELELKGNAWRDLAGRRLRFVNPKPTRGVPEGLVTRQTGVIGDCTASRKVKVPDVSPEEFRALYKQRKPFPWHWGNSLYLEWFSTANGRVVIESADFQLTVDPETTWDMTEAEEEAQRRANAESMNNFMGQLGDIVADGAADGDASGSLSGGNPSEMDQPLTETEAEKMQEESDQLVDRIQARMEREGPDADLGRILDEELERRARERGERPLDPEEEATRAERLDEINRAADDALASLDPELEAELNTSHPLAEQAFHLASRLLTEPEERGWISPSMSEEHPLVYLAASASKAGAKLAGALNGYTWPQAVALCANTIVRLKRARRYLNDSLSAAEACAESKLADDAWLSEVHQELNSMAQQCDMLIAELRGRLERGFD